MQFYVGMTIDGETVASSAVFNGTEKQCRAAAKRLNRGAHPRVVWDVFPCA